MNLVTAVVVDRTMQAQEEGERAGDACENDEKEVQIFELISDIKDRNQGQDIILRATLSAMLKEDEIQDRLYEFDWHADTVEDVCAMVDKEGTGSLSLAKLQKQLSQSMRPIEMITMIAMQAEMTTKLESSEQLYRRCCI
jgi:hypothetical protein